MRDRVREELWFNAQVMQEAARWLEQNRDAEQFFLTVECFDPHEPWFVPEHYRRAYDPSDGREQVLSPYWEVPDLDPASDRDPGQLHGPGHDVRPLVRTPDRDAAAPGPT